MLRTKKIAAKQKFPKMNQIVNFVDIMKPRNTQFGIFKFMTKLWTPQKTMVLDKKLTSHDLKKMIIESVYLDSYLEAESAKSDTPKEQLLKEVLSYLDEIATDKKLHVIRWMGIIFLKISFMMKIGMYVDEPAISKLKATIGNNPVLFLPTHRSYADFCLMAYLCFHYDIEIPAVAAGMDFYSMAVLGQSMRETGAFYIRRTLVGAPLYAATLRHYVRTLVATHDAPIEFFLEGTRSRSNKSLPPKYGMLAMTLVPYFARQVTDITIVPINISYDRLMEQSLFSYEHLGVPKPKESTGGLLKSLHVLNDHFGNIYIKLGDPISLKEYLGKDDKLSSESLKPLDLQQLTPEQVHKVQNVAEHVVLLQQRNTIVTITNLVSIVLMGCLMRNQTLVIDEVLNKVEWLIDVLRSLGATVFENDVKSSMERILLVHKNMLKIEQNRLKLVPCMPMHVGPEIQKKMKGHILKAETMAFAIPVIQLQLYVNPVLHYLVPPALIYLIVQRGVKNKDDLAKDYYQVRKILRYEYFSVEKNDAENFNAAFEYCLQNNVIWDNEGILTLGTHEHLQWLLRWAILPALTTLCVCAEIMTEKKKCEHKYALKLVQERVEARHYHPYCLSLEAAGNCMQGLVYTGALARHKRQQEIIYEAVPFKLEECIRLVSSILPKISVDFRHNSIILKQKNVTSKL